MKMKIPLLRNISTLVSLLTFALRIIAAVEFKEFGVNERSMYAPLAKRIDFFLGLPNFKEIFLKRVRDSSVFQSNDTRLKCQTYARIFNKVIYDLELDVPNYKALRNVESYLRFIKGVFEEDRGFHEATPNIVKSIVNELRGCLVLHQYGFEFSDGSGRKFYVAKDRMMRMGINGDSMLHRTAVSASAKLNLDEFVQKISSVIAHVDAHEPEDVKCRRLINEISVEMMSAQFNFSMKTHIYDKTEKLIRLSMGIIEMSDKVDNKEILLIPLRNCLKLDHFGLMPEESLGTRDDTSSINSSMPLETQ